MKIRTFILATCAVFALVAPAAQAATSTNRIYQAKAQTTRFQKTGQLTGQTRSSKRAKARSTKVVQARTATSIGAPPAVPGTGIPVNATTSDDYDSTNMTGGPQPWASSPAQGNSVQTTTPDLIDGYLWIDQVG